MAVGSFFGIGIIPVFTLQQWGRHMEKPLLKWLWRGYFLIHTAVLGFSPVNLTVRMPSVINHLDKLAPSLGFWWKIKIKINHEIDYNIKSSIKKKEKVKTTHSLVEYRGKWCGQHCQLEPLVSDTGCKAENTVAIKPRSCAFWTSHLWHESYSIHKIDMFINPLLPSILFIICKTWFEKRKSLSRVCDRNFNKNCLKKECIFEQ